MDYTEDQWETMLVNAGTQIKMDVLSYIMVAPNTYSVFHPSIDRFDRAECFGDVKVERVAYFQL